MWVTTISGHGSVRFACAFYFEDWIPAKLLRASRGHDFAIDAAFEQDGFGTRARAVRKRTQCLSCVSGETLKQRVEAWRVRI